MTFLTRQDLIVLTGAVKRPVQIRWLMERGYRFEVGTDGNPKVLWSAVEARLGESAPKRKRPNWSAVQ